MQYTTKLNLGKPEATDIVNATSRAMFNSNFDTIDNELANDYITEISTITLNSVVWNYRKWKSGYIELWVNNISLDFPTASSRNTFYRSIVNIDMSGVCDDLYSVNVTSAGWVMLGSVNGTTTTTAEICKWSSSALASATVNGIGINITGHYDTEA